MIPITDERIEDYLMELSFEDDPLLLAMEARGRSEEFPIVDRLVGRLIYLVTRLKGPSLVVEMGSGFGYSAYWFARALKDAGTGGRVVLTDYDAEHISSARETFRRAGLSEFAEFHTGDAMKSAAEYENVDILFIDMDKKDYPRALEAMLPRLSPHALIVADNTLWYGKVADGTDDEDTRAIREFNRSLYSLEGFFTTIVPLRDGVLLSYRL
jgi:predicted O-methyltransferase YrrM